MITLRYGINRRRPGSRRKTNLQHENHTIELEGIDFFAAGAHGEIIKSIQEKHPGWAVTGYALVKLGGIPVRTCECNEILVLSSPVTNTCQKCGAVYNGGGERLNENWGSREVANPV